MEVRELLRGKWLEYSGGSRPGTNRIRFIDAERDAVCIELCYVFDWNTREIQHLSFQLTRAQFDKLVEELLTAGYGILDTREENKSLLFEWKATDTGFAFRLKGHTLSAFEGPIGIDLVDFHNVDCGRLTRG